MDLMTSSSGITAKTNLENKPKGSTTGKIVHYTEMCVEYTVGKKNNRIPFAFKSSRKV